MGQGFNYKRMNTREQKEHYSKLADFGCVLCYYLGYGEGTPAEIHHIRRAGKRDNAPVIPLCPPHHRGTQFGVHGLGRKAFEKLHGTSEEQLLELINGKIEENKNG